MSAYRRSYSREDPRLSRQSVNVSPKTTEVSNNDGASHANNGRTSAENWNSQTVSYNHTQALQNAYQSLPFHNTGGHQYPTQTYYTGYQNYSYNPYENYQATQQATYLQSAGEPQPPGEEYPHGSWMASNNYSSTISQEQSVPAPEVKENATSIVCDKKKTDAVAEEKIKQLAGLIKERDTYEDRVASLKKKLRLLVSQKEDLSAKRSPDNENLRIIKENTKLQVEIQSKIKDASNVIEILSNLIGDKKRASKASVEQRNSKDDVPSISGSEKMNYKHFDPEIHWCRLCDVFPQSAKELLLHLHSKGHQTQAAAQEEIPWHKLPPEPKFPTHEGAPVKRVPIKGLQFFVASTAWYCRLCDVWIGDLHCASQHLMSVTHSQNYANFVEQNVHWETEWMKDREKALDRLKRNKSETNEGDADKRHDQYSPITTPDGKKKKRSKRRKKKDSSDSSSSSSSSSSSEEEDKSKSIRVAMRKKLLDNDGKLNILEKIVRQGKKEETADDKLLSQWMTTTTDPVGKDKQLLDNLKEKLKQKQDAEKAKIAFEAEIARRQKEKEEMERKERERQEQRDSVKEEEKKHREKMSLKLKQQPSIRDSSYRRRSKSRSPDRRRRRSISPSRRTHRNGREGRENDDRSPRFERNRRSRSRSYERYRDRRRSRSRSRDSRRGGRDDEDASKDKFGKVDKKLPFIGRMPLFKNNKPKPRDDDTTREIQKEDYELPRKTRFQPGNLARAFIPQPEVVCFPQLSSIPPIPPIPPPPPPITPVVVPDPPKISTPKPPPPPKLQEPVVAVEPQKLEPKAERALMEAAREEAPECEPEADESTVQQDAQAESDEANVQAMVDGNTSEDYMLYEDTSNTLFQYGNYNMMYPAAYNFVPVNAMNADASAEVPSEMGLPKSHTLPLEPPPLPPDDPEEDLAMLGLSSDDMAVKQMY